MKMIGVDGSGPVYKNTGCTVYLKNQPGVRRRGLLANLCETFLT